MAHAAGEQLDQHLIRLGIGKLDFVHYQRFLRFDKDGGSAFDAHVLLLSSRR
jgi:hypothetical protein